MNIIKDEIEGVAEKSPQSIMPNNFVKDYPICIFRTQDVISHEEYLAHMENALSIFQHIKRKFGYRINDNDRWRICPPPNKFVSILRKYLAR